jgi:asparagine synthase (glutamine-hydrolysing)
LLREIALSLVPRRLIERPKFGFAVPLDEWFRQELASLYRDVVLSPDAQLSAHLDQSVARELLVDHLRGPVENGRRMWQLLAFEMWARRWSTAAMDLAA